MRPEVDREPGEVLYAGGLHDAAAALDAPWEPTTGHFDDRVDPFPPRRVDGVRVTRDMVPALQSVETVRTPESLRVSDHLPVVVTLAPERLG